MCLDGGADEPGKLCSGGPLGGGGPRGLRRRPSPRRLRPPALASQSKIDEIPLDLYLIQISYGCSWYLGERAALSKSRIFGIESRFFQMRGFRFRYLMKCAREPNDVYFMYIFSLSIINGFVRIFQNIFSQLNNAFYMIIIQFQAVTSF